MAPTVRIINRNLASERIYPLCQFNVTRYSNNVFWGPRAAEVRVIGPDADLKDLFLQVRAGVEIYSSALDPVWWGRIRAAELNIAGGKLTISIDNMANRVKCAYTYQNPNGSSAQAERYTTDWVQDDESVSEFGYFEAMPTLSNAAPAQAVAYAAAVLSGRAMPARGFLADLNSGAKDGIQAMLVLTLEGWGESLKDRFYDNLQGSTGLSGDGTEDGAKVVEFVGYDAENTTLEFGKPGSEMGFQPFTIGGDQPVWLTNLRIKIVAIGAPTDDVVTEIWTYAGGVVATMLGAADTLAGAKVGVAHNWQGFKPTNVLLVPGVPYAIRVRRSGALDAVNYYRWAAHTTPVYAPGPLKYWTGAAWSVMSPLTYAYFEVTAEARQSMVDVGAVAARQRAAQSFKDASLQGYSVVTCSLWVGKYGNPTDDYILYLAADAAGAPGAVLASVTINATLFFHDPTKTAFDFATFPGLAPGVSYWVYLQRVSGANDPLNFVYVRMYSRDPTNPYVDGTYKVWTGSAWAARSIPTDLVFEIIAGRETTQQIADIVAARGPFITAVDIDTPSGVYSPVFQNGDSKAIDIVEDLLKSGTAGGGRLMSKITIDRRLQIVSEPTSDPTKNLRFGKAGGLITSSNAAVDDETPTVGQWASFIDESLGTFDLYIVEWEYMGEGRRPRIQTRNTDDLGAL